MCVCARASAAPGSHSHRDEWPARSLLGSSEFPLQTQRQRLGWQPGFTKDGFAGRARAAASERAPRLPKDWPAPPGIQAAVAAAAAALALGEPRLWGLLPLPLLSH